MATRGLRLIKALESYSKTKPNQFDTSLILKKMAKLGDSKKKPSGAQHRKRKLEKEERNKKLTSPIDSFDLISIKSISEDKSISNFKVDKSMCNGGDTLHGGFIAACVDALSTFAHLGSSGKIAWTMSLHVDFITAARIGEEITIETSAMRQGSYPVVETKFSNAEGGLVAKAVTSLMNGADKYQGLVKEIYHFEA